MCACWQLSKLKNVLTTVLKGLSCLMKASWQQLRLELQMSAALTDAQSVIAGCMYVHKPDLGSERRWWGLVSLWLWLKPLLWSLQCITQEVACHLTQLQSANMLNMLLTRE